MIRSIKGTHAFLGAFFVFILAAILQFKLYDFLKFYPDLALVTLVVLAFFLGFLEILFLTVLGVFMLNWQPAVSIEMIAFALIPLLVFWISRFLPGKLWFSVLIFSAVAIFLFYGIIDFSLLIKELPMLLKDVLGSLIFTSLVFYLFDNSFKSG